MAKVFDMELAREQYGKVFHTEKMVEHCVKSLDSFVELGNELYPIEKPHMVKDFYFGYHDSMYDTESYDLATEMADAASKSFSYFIEQNLDQSNIDRWLKILRSYANGDACWVIKVYPHYYSQTSDCRLVGIDAYKPWQVHHRDTERDLTKDEAKALVVGYEAARQRFEKKLNTYLKTHGLSHVSTGTYWADR